MLLGLTNNSEGDPFFNDVIILMHFDVPGTNFIDIIPKTWSIASASPVQGASPSVFGGGSLSGVSGIISTPSFPRMNWGTANFTIEYWQFYAGLGGIPPFSTPFSFGYSSAGGILIQGSTSSGNGRMTLYMNGVAVCTESGTPATQGQWYFYEINRQGTTCVIRRNGVQTASGTSAASINNAANVFFGGTTNGGGRGSNSYLDDFRVTVNHARFDPIPTRAFPNHL